MEDIKKSRVLLTLKEIIYSIALALILVLIITKFFLQLYWIPSPSMEPTLLVGDRIVVTKFDYWAHDPERGDIIVFKFPEDSSRSLIKRIIGLPGETVVIKDSILYIDGVPIMEKYIQEQVYPDYGPVKVPAEQLFVMGDNRDGSYDSRYWGFLPREMVVGKAHMRYWPLNRISGLN